MQSKKIITSVIFGLFFSTFIIGQSQYQQLLTFADNALSEGDYDTAIEGYLTIIRDDTTNLTSIATTKADSVYSLIRKLEKDERAQRIKANNLANFLFDKNVEIERQKDAIVAKNDAILTLNDSLLALNDSLKIVIKEKEAAKLVAETEAAKTKATYFAYLADEYIKKEQYDSAFKQAYLAKLTIDTFKVDSTLAPIYETFGKAVYYAKRDTLSKNDFSIDNALFSKKGNYILTYGQKDKRYEAILTDESGRHIKTIQHKKPILSVSIASAEDKVLTCSADGTAQLYDIIRDTIIPFKEHSDEVVGGSFSKDGNYIATWSRDDITFLWKPNGELINTLGKHNGNVYDVVFSPDEKFIATRSSDQTVNLWGKNGQFLHLLKGPTSYIYHIAFSPDSKYLLTCSADSTARLWDMDGRNIDSLQHSALVRWGTFSKDGNSVITISQDNKINIWERKDKFELVKELEHNTSIKEAWFSKDERRILACEQGKYLTIWEVETGEGKPLEKHTDELLSARFCGEGRYILTHSKDNTAKLWCAKDGIVLMEMNHQSATIPQFTPDGEHIIASSEDSILEKIPLPENIYNTEKLTKEE